MSACHPAMFRGVGVLCDEDQVVNMGMDMSDEEMMHSSLLW